MAQHFKAGWTQRTGRLVRLKVCCFDCAMCWLVNHETVVLVQANWTKVQVLRRHFSVGGNVMPQPYIKQFILLWNVTLTTPITLSRHLTRTNLLTQLTTTA